MTPDLANEYIQRRMQALGRGDYQMWLRHLVLQPNETRIIQAGLHLYLLASMPNAIRIESDMGVFDLSETKVNELQYEHQGTITITNQSHSFQHLPMIQVIIPKSE